MKSIRSQSQNVLSESEFAELTRLLECRGPSGFEDAPQSTFLDMVDACADETGQDAYGNAWAITGDSDLPTVLVVGHGDEIGLMISHIEKEGFLRVNAVGGVDPQTLVARRVWLQTAKNDHIAGVVGALPIHLQDRSGEQKAPKIWDLTIDVGASSAEEVAEMGVQIGCIATLQEEWMLFPNERIVSRALDNRLGVFTAAQALKRYAHKVNEGAKPKFRLAAVSSVQEEIGAVGAEMIARRLAPAAAIVVDVTHGTDIPGCSHSRYGKVELGAGPTVTHGSANHRGLLAAFEKGASAADVCLQHEASSRYTGTDADTIYRALYGIPSIVVSIPNRYMHTTAEMSHLGDINQAIESIVSTVLNLETDQLGTHLGA